LANYFQIDANCSQKLDAHIFFKIASPHLETTSQGYLDIANGVYNIVKASQSALNIATNIASFNGISSLSGEELAVLGVTKSADFVAELTNNEYAQVWLPLGTCAIKAAILAPDISSCSALVTQSYNILTNFALTFSYLDASEKINTITVAHEYLYRLYSWGGSENFLANSYGLGGGASFEDVLKKVAQSFGFKDDTISYLAGKSYNWHMAQGIIQKAQTMMANFRQSFDKDNDGIYDGLQPVIDQSPLAGLPGTTFIQKGRLFTPFSTATLHFKKPDGSEYPISEIETDNKGRFEISYAAPSDKSPGNYTWWAIDDTSGRKSNEISYEISKLPASMPALEYNVPFLYSGYTYTDYYISELSPDLSYAYNNENYSYMATYYANRIQPQPEYDLFQGDIRGIGLACFTGYSTPPAGPSGTFCLQGDNEGYAPHFSRCYNRYAEQWEPCPNVYRGFLPPSKPLSESTRTTFPLHIMNYLPNDFQGDYGLGVVQWGQKVLDPNY
jgi:5-hydroxyisourate hydrolase-like protein (transthyretin family)